MVKRLFSRAGPEAVLSESHLEFAAVVPVALAVASKHTTYHKRTRIALYEYKYNALLYLYPILTRLGYEPDFDYDCNSYDATYS